MRRLTVTAFLLALSLPSLFGADLTGKWSGQSDEGPNFVFKLKSDKDSVSGSMVRDDKEYPISEGKVNGDDVSFTVDTEYQGNPIKLVVKGKLAADTLQLHIETGDGGWSTEAKLKRAL